MSTCVRTTALLLLVYLLSFISSLPFLPQEPQLRPRAKYSVVAVDGSTDDSPATIDSQPSPADTKTVTETQDQTQTVTASTNTSPTIAVTFTSTKIIEAKVPQETAQVSSFTDVEKSKTSVAKAKVKIVNVDPQEDAVLLSSSTLSSTAPPRSSTTSSKTSLRKPSSTSISPTKSVNVILCDESTSRLDIPNSATSSAAATISSSAVWYGPSSPAQKWRAEPNKVVWKGQQDEYKADPASSTSSSLAALTTSTTPTTSTHSYDNGMWHTSYPAWNATSTTGLFASSMAPLYRR